MTDAPEELLAGDKKPTFARSHLQMTRESQLYRIGPGTR
jgi:hypothetical protein